MFNICHAFEIERLDSMTRYPSILTYHKPDLMQLDKAKISGLREHNKIGGWRMAGELKAIADKYQDMGLSCV